MDKDFQTLGYKVFPHEDALFDWAVRAAPIALAAAQDTDQHNMWLRSNGTWFVGVDTVPLNADDCINGSAPLAGAGAAFARSLQSEPWDGWGAGQGSICYPKYPLQDKGESDASFRYRARRDSAHLDGLKPIGPNRRRHFDEFHSFIFGIPLGDVDAGAAPFVIWEGSHHIFGEMLAKVFDGIDPKEWHAIDITDIYGQTRARIFDTCKRIEIPAKQGACYVAHRFSLHGVAPWTATGPDAHRSIVYFRPYWTGSLRDWLQP